MQTSAHDAPSAPSTEAARLLDATGALVPSDRALVDLWVRRGFDDQRLAMLSGIPAPRLSARRERLVTRLAALAEADPAHVRAELTALAAGVAAAAAPALPRRARGVGGAVSALLTAVRRAIARARGAPPDTGGTQRRRASSDSGLAIRSK
ncbi:MAG: hypothetical protein ACRDMX_10075 [Solirubrobacteraceae bacterium]